MPAPILFRRTLAALCLIGGLTCSAQAQEWANKMFSATKHDFGTVARGSEAKHRIIIKNLYKEDVHISNVRTTCGCTAAKPSQSSLKSLETAYIEIVMNTRKFSHLKESNVIVTFDAPFPAEVRIPIRAYIRTDIVMSPGSINFPNAEMGTASQQKMSITYAGRADWKILDVKTDSKYFKPRIVQTSRNNGQVVYNLEVDLSADAPAGLLRDQVVLYTDDANTPRVPVIMEANVKADITITPASVDFRVLKPGEEKTVNVVFRGRKDFEITMIECDSDEECFRIRLPKTAKRVHVLPLTMTTPAKPGKFTEQFTVTIAGRKAPLTFTASGLIKQKN